MSEAAGAAPVAEALDRVDADTAGAVGDGREESRRYGAGVGYGVTPRQVAYRRLLTDFATFSRACYPGRGLRGYQLDAAAPILAAVEARAGGAFCCLFSRQAGKDELLAQLQAFLLARFQRRGGAIVLATPTYKPQALISRRRLVGRLTPAQVDVYLANRARRWEPSARPSLRT